MIKTITPLFIFFTVFTFSQNQFEKGVIIDSIPVGNNEGETFALYLPNSFNQKNISSAIYVFDPSGKGRNGLKPFIKASEKYGYIIFCSNNSKNGPYEKNFKIFNNLFSHTTSVFKIRNNSIYLSGFSGGSRLACAIATLTEQFTGVIACGAGFPQVPEYMPSTQSYDYVGICGNRDFNYSEMIENKIFLNQAKFNHTLITNNSKHKWPNENEILKAFNWLNLQKQKKQASIKDKEQILNLYLNDFNEILKNEENNELIFASENYERLLDNYSSFITIDSIQKKFDKLKQSGAYLEQTKQLSEIFMRETTLNHKLLTRFDEDLKKPNNKRLAWWRKQLNKLDLIEKSSNLAIKNMIFRTKFKVFATVYSVKKLYSKDKNQLQLDYITALLKLFNNVT
ncbi:hypothetical protein N1F78_09640 [Seonamhaeicola sp. MEBiC1930]|uniref:hypothetical protein n=1 Tax=Seonamhaeicola sp. MEBiC01930 TaxID=2976768 RepID=UPI00324EF9D3